MESTTWTIGGFGVWNVVLLLLIAGVLLITNEATRATTR